MIPANSRTSSHVWRRVIGTSTWMPREPLVFGTDSSPTTSSASRTSAATSSTFSNARALGGIEVEHDPVGPLRAVGARRPGVHVDAAHVDHPEERELVVDERVVDHRFSPSRVDAGNGAVAIQSGMCDGACFWKKLFPCQPSG